MKNILVVYDKKYPDVLWGIFSSHKKLNKARKLWGYKSQDLRITYVLVDYRIISGKRRHTPEPR